MKRRLINGGFALVFTIQAIAIAKLLSTAPIDVMNPIGLFVFGFFLYFNFFSVNAMSVCLQEFFRRRSNNQPNGLH